MVKAKYANFMATGLKEIDDQHQRFLSLCAAIIDAAAKNETKEIEKEKIEALEKYAYVHFKTEQAFMFKYKYPDYDGHNRLHSHFMDELKTIRSRALHGETGRLFSSEIKEKIYDWFVLHIEKNDLKMIAFIKDVM